MNRLQILKKRAARGGVGVVRLRDGWFVASARGWGDCAGPYSRREAIQMAARWAMPKRIIMTVTVGHDDGTSTVTRIKLD